MASPRPAWPRGEEGRIQPATQRAGPRGVGRKHTPELMVSVVAAGASESEERFLWEGSKGLVHGGWGESGKVGGVGAQAGPQEEAPPVGRSAQG